MSRWQWPGGVQEKVGGKEERPAAKISCLGSAHSKGLDSVFERIKENFKC